MDTQGLLPAPAKPPRRQHSLEFKKQVVAASYTDNTSVAIVAQQFNINANLVHKLGASLTRRRLAVMILLKLHREFPLRH